MRNRQKILCIVLCFSLFFYHDSFQGTKVMAYENLFQVSAKSNSRFFTGKKILPEQFLWCIEEDTIEDLENAVVKPAYIYEEGTHTIQMQYAQGEESYEQQLEVYVESVTVVAIHAEKIKKYAAKGEPFGKEEIGPVYVCYNDGRKVEDWDYTYEIDWDTGVIEIACKGATVTYALEVDESKLEGLTVECKREKVYEDTILTKDDFVVTGCFSSGARKELEEYTLYPYCLKSGETAIILFERHNAMGYCKVYVEDQEEDKTTVVEEEDRESTVENDMESAAGNTVEENPTMPASTFMITASPEANGEPQEMGERDSTAATWVLVEMETEQPQKEQGPVASACATQGAYNKLQETTPAPAKESVIEPTKEPLEVRLKSEEDQEAPTVNLKEKTYTKPVKIKVSDSGSGIADIILNGKKVKNQTMIEKEGKHTLVVTDQAGNTKKVSFVLAFPVKKITVSHYMTEKWNQLLFSAEIVGSGRKPKWRLSNPKVGSISKNGKLYAKKTGISYVIASLGKKSAKKKIVVDAKNKYVLIY